MTKKKDYYTSREAATLLGVAVSTVQLWTKNGLLSAWTTGGGHRRIARGSVDEMLQAQEASRKPMEADKKLSIVIVEDDARQRRLYEKQFLAWQVNAQVETAKDGFEGLIKIGRVLPDVIITDLQMPNVDGFQMIKSLKELSELEHCVIIIATGLTKEEINAKGGLPAGVNLFTKPVLFKDMVNLIRQKEREKAA